jgi:hypothetical protein
MHGETVNCVWFSWLSSYESLNYRKLKVFVFFPFQCSYYKFLRVFNDFVINLEVSTTFICLKFMFSSVSSSVVVHTVETSLYNLRSDVTFLLSHPPNLNFFFQILLVGIISVMVTKFSSPIWGAYECKTHFNFTVLPRCWKVKYLWRVLSRLTQPSAPWNPLLNSLCR